jgi:hypothetical protein
MSEKKAKILRETKKAVNSGNQKELVSCISNLRSLAIQHKKFRKSKQDLSVMNSVREKGSMNKLE